MDEPLEKRILQKLKSKEVHGENFSGILDLFSSTTQKNALWFCAHFLQGVKDVVWSGVCTDDLINATLLCCKYYRENVIDAKKVVKKLTILQFFYHILAKVPWQNHLESMERLGMEMKELLELVKDNVQAASPIIHNSYNLFLSIALNLEKKSDFTDYSLSLKFRLLGFRIVLLKPDVLNTVLDKFYVSLDRYGYLMKFKQASADEKNAEISENFQQIYSIADGIIKSLQASENNCESDITRVFYNLVKLLTRFNLFVELENYLRTFTNDCELLSILELSVRSLTLFNSFNVAVSTEIKFDKKNVHRSLQFVDNVNLLDFSEQECEIICDIFIMCVKMVPQSFKNCRVLEDNLWLTFMSNLVTFFNNQQKVTSDKLVKLKRDASKDTQPIIKQSQKTLVEVLKAKLSVIHVLVSNIEDEKRMEFVEEARNICSNDIKVASSLLKEKTRDDFLTSYGCMMGKIGLTCYNLSMADFDVYFAELSCNLLTQFCTVSGKLEVSRVNESHLWMVYENLVEFNRKSKRWKPALIAAAKGVLVDGRNIATFVKRWVHIKLSAVEEGLSQHLYITLKSIVGQSPLWSDEIEISFLKSELEMFQKKRCSEGICHTLKQLVELVNDNYEKAVYCLMLASSVNIDESVDIKSSDCDKSSEAYLTDALNLLPSEDKSEGAEKILLGQIYLMKYILAHEKTCSKTFNQMALEDPQKESETNTENDREKDKEKENNDSLPLPMIADEQKLVAILDRAVDLWLDCYTTTFTDQTKRDHFIESLQLCAAIYCTVKRPIKESQVLSMLKWLCEDNDVLKQKAVVESARLLTSLNLHQTASQQLSALPTLTATGKSDTDQYLFQLSMIESGLTTNSLKKSEELLQDLEAKVAQRQQADLTTKFLKGLLNRLQSNVSQLQREDNSQHLYYALDFAYEAYRMHANVVQFFFSKKNKGGRPEQKWLLVNELLNTTLNLTKLYRHIGEDSSARCYAREGLSLAKGLHLPRWCLLFLFEMNRTYGLICSLKDSQDVLQKIDSILQTDNASKSKIIFPCPVEKTSSKLNKDTITKDLQRKRSLVDNCFGFESIRDAGIFNDHEIFSEIPEVTSMKDSGTVFTPSHDICCQCCVCNDDSLLDLTGLFWFNVAEVCFHNQYYSQAKNLLTKVVERCENKQKNIAEKMSFVKSLLGSSTEKMTEGFSLNSDLHTESHCLLAECSLHLQLKDDVRLHYSKALELLDANISKNFQEYFLRARLSLCEVNLLLSELETTFDDLASDFVDLCITEEGSETTESENLCEALQNCHLGNKEVNQENEIVNGSTQKVYQQNKKSVRKIKFDSPGIQTSPSDSPSVLPMVDDSPETDNLQDVSMEMVPPSPVKPVKVLFSKTPLKASIKKPLKKSSTNYLKIDCAAKSPSEDDHAISEAKSLKSTSKSLRASFRKSVKQSTNQVHIFCDASVSPSDDVFIIEDNEPDHSSKLTQISRTNKSHRITKSKSESARNVDDCLQKPVESIKPVRARTTRKTKPKVTVNGENDQVSEKTSDVCDSKSRIPRIQSQRKPAKTVQTEISNKTSADDLDDSPIIVKRSGRSVRKMKLNLDSDDDGEKLSETTVKPSARKTKTRAKSALSPKVTQTRTRSVRSCKKTTLTVESDDDIDIYSFKGSITPTKTKRVPKKRAVKSAKKTVEEVSDIENLRNSTRTPEMEKILEVSSPLSPISMNSFSPILLDTGAVTVPVIVVEEEDEIEVLRGLPEDSKKKRVVSQRSIKHKQEEVLRSDMESEKENIDISPRCLSTSFEGGSNGDMTSTLLKAYNQIRHFPSNPSYSSICKLLALMYMSTNPYKTASYLAESAAVTFRHQQLLDIGKKIRKLEKSKTSMMPEDYEKSRQTLIESQQFLAFNKDDHNVEDITRDLPPEWTVCQVSVVEYGGRSKELLLTRLCNNIAPITIKLPGFHSKQGNGVLEEFTSVLNTSNEFMELKTTDKNEFWRTRKQHDERLERFQVRMQKDWLGVWKNMLLGQVKHSTDISYLYQETLSDFKSHLSGRDYDILKVLLNVCEGLSCVEIRKLSSNLIQTTDPSLLKKISDKIELMSEKLSSSLIKRHPVILILDKVVQHLPWENLPVLKGHCVTRVPSLYYLSTLLTSVREDDESVFTQGVDPEKTFYLVNPDGNLPSTQEFFNTYSQKKNQLAWCYGQETNNTTTVVCCY